MYKSSNFSTSLPIFISHFFIIGILLVVKLYLIVVLTCILLMISEVEHLFMFLLMIQRNISSSPQVPLLNWVVCFCSCWSWLLKPMTSLHILDINLLPDIWFANIFSRSIGFLFTLMTVSLDSQKLLSISNNFHSLPAVLPCLDFFPTIHSL